jgi:Cell division protein
LIQKDNNYVSGTAARKLEYDVYEQNNVLKAKKKYKNNRMAKFRLVLSMMAVFIVGFIVVYRFALITQMSYNINKSESVYNQIRNENSLLRMQVEKNTDLTRIKELAETKLGMQKPDKSQIVYIRVPKNDYTVVLNSGEDTEAAKGGLFAGILDKVAGLMNLIN